MLDWILEAWGSWFALLPYVLIGVVIMTIIVTIGWALRGLYRWFAGRARSGG